MMMHPQERYNDALGAIPAMPNFETLMNVRTETGGIEINQSESER